jgi:serine/threonine-protein kinase
MPSVIGQYRITGVLGEGGMGVVYAAEHTLLGRPAAVKVLLPDLSSKQEVVQRFFNEARAATAIRHPGIVEIYDFGWTAEGAAFIVMEHLQGETLRDRRKRGLMPWNLALSVTRQIAGALGAAHAKGIVHRDLKPDNVFLVPDPEVPGGERIKLLDFGIAKLAGSEAGLHKTRTGAVIGTPTYMAPEQCRGVSVDSRADLYALGCILFELISGRPPFVGEGEGDVLAAHIYVPVPALGSLVHGGLPKEIETLVQRLLAKAPIDRAQTADEVIRLIDAATTTLSGPRAILPSPAASMAAVARPAPTVAHADSLAGGTIYSDTTLSSAASTAHRIPRQRAARRRLVLLGAAGGAIALATAAIAIIVGSGGDAPSMSTASIPPSPVDAATGDAEATAPPPPPPPPSESPSPAARQPSPAPAPTPEPPTTPAPTTPAEPDHAIPLPPEPEPARSPSTPKAPKTPPKVASSPATEPKAPPPAPAPPAPTTIEVMITSSPSGADIFREGNFVGRTPHRLSLARTGRDVKLVLKLGKNHQPSTITVHTDAPSKQHVKLVPVAHNQAVNPFD